MSASDASDVQSYIGAVTSCVVLMESVLSLHECTVVLILLNTVATCGTVEQGV